MRAIITIGEVNGMMLHQTDSVPFGFCIVVNITTIAKTSGIVAGICNCWASCALSTALPTAAKIAA